MTRTIFGLALLLTALHPATGHAQKAQNDAASSQTYLDFQVDQQVRVKVARAPLYPDQLRSVGIEGRVLVQFVVDEHGKPDMASFKVIKSTEAALTESVKQAVSGMMFYPAEAAGQKVKQLVQMPFMFTPIR